MKAPTKPESWDFNHVADYAYDSDGRYCSGQYCTLDGGDSPCRDSVYEGLRIDASELDAVHSVHRAIRGAISREDLPASGLVEHVSKFVDLEDPENFEVSAENGYYGEEAFVSLQWYAQDEFAAALDSWDGWLTA